MSDTPTVSSTVAAHSRARPDRLAFATGDSALTWREYHDAADGLAGAIAAHGVTAGERVGVWLPDGCDVHVAFVACERAGAVVVGVGPRAGVREVEHLLDSTGVRTVITDRTSPGRERIDPTARAGAAPTTRALGADALSLCNSTSGTTGMPKVVMHDQARWFAFHDLAQAAGALTSDDVFLSAIPAPFGFGLWTAHFTPTLLGAPCVVLPKWSPGACLDAIERHRVSVLACVSTQFVMLLADPTFPDRDLSSLRVMFTGGEMVPYERAAEFEERTGCTILQFYGSNETGALSNTALGDPRERRLRTAGRVIPSQHVRLYDEDGADVTATGRGIAACRGPTICRGYFDDDAANARLYTPDGWMLTGDIVEIDAEGWLTVVGRASDFIIRGGKNISAAEVEHEVGSHPAVALAAAVAAPDAVYGERVRVYVEPRPGSSVTLGEIREHLAARGTGKELWPEDLVVLAELPRSSGGKVAKGLLRDDATGTERR